MSVLLFIPILVKYLRHVQSKSSRSQCWQIYRMFKCIVFMTDAQVSGYIWLISGWGRRNTLLVPLCCWETGSTSTSNIKTLVCQKLLSRGKKTKRLKEFKIFSLTLSWRVTWRVFSKISHSSLFIFKMMLSSRRKRTNGWLKPVTGGTASGLGLTWVSVKVNPNPAVPQLHCSSDHSVGKWLNWSCLHEQLDR